MINGFPSIYPDYIGTTIPATIAPLNFDLKDESYDCIDVVIKGRRGNSIHINGQSVSIPEDEWKDLLYSNKGGKISVTVALEKKGKWKQYKSFPIYISRYAIDSELVYRLIAPGYEVYSKMGIYRRNLSSFVQTPILENTLVPGMCVNCHAFNKTNSSHTSIHVRGDNGGTIMMNNGKVELLDTHVQGLLSSCVYPYWHPSGEYIAYSLNNTRQSFHAIKDERIEVLDMASDVVVYHPATHELLVCKLLTKKDSFETFPVFSADGKTLYFCSATKENIPSHYKDIRYNLCSISFNPQNGTFGDKVDTIINADRMKKSISFPRPSYDGKYIMFTLSDYGNFSIWHKEADLWMINLKDGKLRRLDEVNSNDTESYHNWSSNSHWFVFSSRRDNGLYTRLYIAGIDENGRITKPFMLPQKHPSSYYDGLIYSYNVPDFHNGQLKLDIRNIESSLKSKDRVKLKIKRC
jgi:hypothetical protein